MTVQIFYISCNINFGNLEENEEDKLFEMDFTFLLNCSNVVFFQYIPFFLGKMRSRTHKIGIKVLC